MAKDDRSIRMVSSSKELKWYEKIDIEEGLYEGWDVSGYLIKLVWDSQLGPKVEILEERPYLDQLRNAIKEYAQNYRPKVPFNCSNSNVIELFKTAEDHINQDKLVNKIRGENQKFS